VGVTLVEKNGIWQTLRLLATNVFWDTVFIALPLFYDHTPSGFSGNTPKTILPYLIFGHFKPDTIFIVPWVGLL